MPKTHPAVDLPERRPSDLTMRAFKMLAKTKGQDIFVYFDPDLGTDGEWAFEDAPITDTFYWEISATTGEVFFVTAMVDEKFSALRPLA